MRGVGLAGPAPPGHAVAVAPGQAPLAGEHSQLAPPVGPYRTLARPPTGRPSLIGPPTTPMHTDRWNRHSCGTGLELRLTSAAVHPTAGRRSGSRRSGAGCRSGWAAPSACAKGQDRASGCERNRAGVEIGSGLDPVGLSILSPAVHRYLDGIITRMMNPWTGRCRAARSRGGLRTSPADCAGSFVTDSGG